MSFFQPLITTAFSSYAVNRGAFGGRTQEVSDQNEVDPSGQVGIVSPSQETQRTHGIDKAQEANGTTDRDFDKPKSASGDVLDISNEAQRKLETQEKLNQAVQDKIDDAKVGQRIQDQAEESTKTDSQISVDGNLKSEEGKGTETSLKTGASELTSEEQQQVNELKARDAEVRQHEQQHVSTGGQYVTSGPSYTYQTGPDGQSYAIGGEVGIDTAPVKGDPEATIQKMQTVAAAALAPAEPSDQDYKVAAAARQTEAQARAELNAQNVEEMSSSKETEESNSTDATKSLNTEDSSTQNQSTKRSMASSNIVVTDSYRLVSGQTETSRFSAFA